MRAIQVILLSMLTGGVATYFARLRSHLMDRTIVLALAILAAFMVLEPDVTTRWAALVGVGRGVDLVTYVSLFTLTFLWLLLFSRLRMQQAHITQLTRAVALDRARSAPEAPLRSERPTA